MKYLLIFFLLSAYNIASIAGEEDIEDLMLRNIHSDDDAPVPFDLIDARSNVKFWLHASGHHGFEELNIDRETYDHMSTGKTRFDPKKKTKVIIHGWMVDGEEVFCRSVRHAYLKHHDFNIITVDWSSLSKGFYLVARVSVHYVGPYVAEMLDYLVDEYGISLDDVHIIGHSLGAHVAGAAGAATKSGKVGRITGLDPAAPMFLGSATTYRLDKENAQFVDVIHTSLLGLGASIGHVDFYPNGGGPVQPGCGTDFAVCTHTRAYHFFVESIGKENTFPALRCKDYTTFLNKQCDEDAELVFMGEHLTTKARGDYYLITNAEEPYSITLPNIYYF